jgi:hypothetical protein
MKILKEGNIPERGWLRSLWENMKARREEKAFERANDGLSKTGYEGYVADGLVKHSLKELRKALDDDDLRNK